MLGIFLDTETTGLNPFKHRIIDFAYKIIDLKTGSLLSDYHSFINQPKNIWENSDPNSLKVNGFTYEMIQDGKIEKTIKEEVEKDFLNHNISKDNAVYFCQNPSFDRIFFAQIIPTEEQNKRLWPYHWLDLASMHWALYLNQKKSIDTFTGFSKDTIANELGLEKEGKPHRAVQGVDHLILCYKKLVGFPEKKI